MIINNMSFSIVVARYIENVEWTKQFQNVIIYNKGEKLNDNYNELFLNNVGREGHTYYKHICDNYENLSDYTIFLQGNPFDHSPNIISNINKYINDEELNIDFEFLSERVDDHTLGHWVRLVGQCRYIVKTWERIFDTTTDNNQECIFGLGAQFIVSKDTILKRPKEFYENIVSILEYSVNPDEGHDVERLHKYIFN